MTTTPAEAIRFGRAEEVPADVDGVFDCNDTFWVRSTDGDWYDYQNEDRFLGLAELVSRHGPLRPAVHERHDAPGPVPGPLPGVCFSCGGTGEVYHGRGPDGPVWGGVCGCDTDYCGTCLEPWPCGFVAVQPGAGGTGREER